MTMQNDLPGAIPAGTQLESYLASADEEIDLLDYLSVLVKYRWMIFKVSGIATIIAVIVSLLLPHIYSATATIMPPRQEEGMSAMLAKMGGLAAMAGGMLGVSTPVGIYTDMLKSRSMTDTIITRYGLMKAYDVELMKEAREELEENVAVETSKADVISVTVEDKDPQRAADMANAYIEELDKLNRTLNISDAARQRIFLEQRLTEAKERLSQAELALKKFQEDNKIIALEAQAQATIEGAAQIKGQIIATETELKMLSGFVSGKETQMIKLTQKLAELKDQLAKIETVHNTTPAKKSGESNFFLGFNQMPDLGLQLARLMREVKIQETVFELLTQQYELAKISEAKDTSTIQILDKAVVPEKKSKPKRALIVALSGITALFGSVFVAFCLEGFSRMDEEKRKRWEEIKAS
ncbi:MAG: lipopolysaccharide biosynthesis protein [Candidatus Schekmanbacteria bacterium]|nr:lipopolysaccharide biosynthesis protein [Candidatus Schekmanbacteria bacterium]